MFIPITSIIALIAFAFLAYREWSKSQEESEKREKEKREEEQRRQKMMHDYEIERKERELLLSNISSVLMHEITKLAEKELFGYSPESLVETIIRNRDYAQLNAVEDIYSIGIKKIIKIALCAENHHLDCFQDMLHIDSKLYRIGKNGKHIILTDEEISKMQNKDYDFILDTITKFD